MNKEQGKEEYRFTIIDSHRTKLMVEEWIKTNNFVEMNDNGRIYYCIHSVMIGDTFFEYSITGDQLVMHIYIGSREKPKRYSLRKDIQAFGTADYRNMILPLLYMLLSSDISTGNNIAENLPQEMVPQPQNSSQQQDIADVTQGISPVGIDSERKEVAEAFSNVAKTRKKGSMVVAIIIIAIIFINVLLFIFRQ